MIAMDVTKDNSGSSGFFSLFGWNRARKRSLKKDSAALGDDKSIKGGLQDNDISTPSPRSTNAIEEEVVQPSTARSDEQSCSSSVIDEESGGKKGLGVVAKLMGLDSMPLEPTISEPNSPMSAVSRFSSISQAQERARNSSPNNHVDIVQKAVEGYSHKPADLGPRKMVTSRIERFQLEVVPPRTMKPFSPAHSRLVSPIRNYSYLPDRNAADIMEAASKIFGGNISVKSSAIASSSSPICIYKSRTIAKIPPKASRDGDMVKKSSEPVRDSLSGMHSETRLNYPGRTASLRPANVRSTDSNNSKGKARTSSAQSRCDALATEATSSVSMKNESVPAAKSMLATQELRGTKKSGMLNSVSLAAPGIDDEAEATRKTKSRNTTSPASQSYMNAHVAEGISSSSNGRSATSVGRARPKVGGSQITSRYKKSSHQESSESSGIQGTMSEVGTECTSSYAKQVKVSRDTNDGQIKRLAKMQNKTRTDASAVILQRNRMQDVTPTDHKSRRSPSMASNTKQKPGQVISLNNTSVERSNRNNVTAANGSAHRKLGSRMTTPVLDDSLPSTSRNTARRSADKSILSGKSRSSDDIARNRTLKRIEHNIVLDEKSSLSKHDKVVNGDIISFTFNLPADKSTAGSRSNSHDRTRNNNGFSNSNLRNVGLSLNDFADGNLLGILLEQKLSELTSRTSSPYKNLVLGDSISTTTVLRDASSAEESSSLVSADYEGESLSSYKDDPDGTSQASFTSENDLATVSGELISRSKDKKDPEQLSNPSLSEDLSCENFELAESWNSSYSRDSHPTEVTRTNSSHPHKILEEEDEVVFSDTASSISAMTAETPTSEVTRVCYLNEYTQEVEFVRDIVCAWTLSGNFSSHYLEHPTEIVNPHIFEELFNRKQFKLHEEQEKERRTRYKVLFGCASELLTAKCRYYFEGGYRLWCKGTLFLGKITAEELYREMNCSKVAEEWMVDELVEREMSTALGKWMDFDAEAFEAGVEIEMELLDYLLDELVDDALTETLL